MSIGFLLASTSDATIMRGPMKHGTIQQLLADVVWGELDYLLLDCPPGTGDEPLSAVQLLGHGSAAVVVTTPQDVALTDVEKSLSFCRELKLPVVGLVENMSGFICPHCGERSDIFKSGGAAALAEKPGSVCWPRFPLNRWSLSVVMMVSRTSCHTPIQPTVRLWSRLRKRSARSK